MKTEEINIPIYEQTDILWNLIRKVLKENNLVICKNIQTVDTSRGQLALDYDPIKFRSLVIEYWKLMNSPIDKTTCQESMITYFQNNLLEMWTLFLDKQDLKSHNLSDFQFVIQAEKDRKSTRLNSSH